MRYFHVGYDARLSNNSQCIGSLTCSREKFISKKEIEEEAKKQINPVSLIVTSIFEFKNEEDFLDFNSITNHEPLPKTKTKNSRIRT